MKFPEYQYNLLKSIVSTGLAHGQKTHYRYIMLKHYSSIMQASDASHTDQTRGEHIVPMMTQIATELGGICTDDKNANGNTKKRSVRLEF